MKGCKKRVIQIKSPKSDIFEEAYFILRPEKEDNGEEDIVLEAERILAESEEGKGHRRFSFGLDEVLFFGAGMLLSMLFFLALWLIL